MSRSIRDYSRVLALGSAVLAATWGSPDPAVAAKQQCKMEDVPPPSGGQTSQSSIKQAKEQACKQHKETLVEDSDTQAKCQEAVSQTKACCCADSTDSSSQPPQIPQIPTPPQSSDPGTSNFTAPQASTDSTVSSGTTGSAPQSDSLGGSQGGSSVGFGDTAPAKPGSTVQPAASGSYGSGASSLPLTEGAQPASAAGNAPAQGGAGGGSGGGLAALDSGGKGSGTATGTATGTAAKDAAADAIPADIANGKLSSPKGSKGDESVSAVDSSAMASFARDFKDGKPLADGAAANEEASGQSLFLMVRSRYVELKKRGDI